LTVIEISGCRMLPPDRRDALTSESLSLYQARLTFDLRCGLRRLASGDWIGNEEIR
jgi:hypothetical protein